MTAPMAATRKGPTPAQARASLRRARARLLCVTVAALGVLALLYPVYAQWLARWS